MNVLTWFVSLSDSLFPHFIGPLLAFYFIHYIQIRWRDSLLGGVRGRMDCFEGRRSNGTNKSWPKKCGVCITLYYESAYISPPIAWWCERLGSDTTNFYFSSLLYKSKGICRIWFPRRSYGSLREWRLSTQTPFGQRFRTWTDGQLCIGPPGVDILMRAGRSSRPVLQLIRPM